MSFNSKLPPRKLVIENGQYNYLIEVVNSFSNIVEKDKGEKLKKLVDKLLKYSIPNDDGTVEVRFYDDEVLLGFEYLIFKGCLTSDVEPENYIEKLKQNRKAYKEQKEKESDNNA
jgi:hypothetical protein